MSHPFTFSVTYPLQFIVFFFFNDTATTEIYTLSLHDALPISLHLAAQIDVRKSAADPAFDARVNVEGTINVLESARRSGARRVVNTSTGGAIYGESKYCAEGYCDLFGRLYGMSTVSLRYGNIYGPRQDPLGEAGVIAIFCGKLLEGGKPTIFGDGLQTRDYAYVGDVVDANLRAAESEATGAINVGLGKGKSVLDVVAVLNEHAPDGFEPDHA